MFELLYVISGVCRIIDYNDFIVKKVSIYDIVENYIKRGKKIEGLSIDKPGDITSPHRNMTVIYNEDSNFNDNIVILAGQENTNSNEYCFKVYFKGASKPCFVYRYNPEDLGISDLEASGMGEVYIPNAYELVICGRSLKRSLCIIKDTSSSSVRVVYRDKVPVPKYSKLQVINSNDGYTFQRLVK